MAKTGDTLLVDYYHGAYGPTIRVNLVSMDDALEFLEILRGLAEGTTRKAMLHDLDGVMLSGLGDFVLRLVSDNSEGKKTLTVITRLLPNVDWAKSMLGWKACADLVRSLIDFNQPAHQYLTKEGLDDAIVEVSFLE